MTGGVDILSAGHANVTPGIERIRRDDLAGAALCVAVLIVALVVGRFHQIGGFGVETDFYGAYAVQAKNLLEGRPYTYLQQPPGYPLLLAAASLLVDDLFLAAKIISAVATAIFGWISYLLVRALFTSRIALATTIVLLPAVFPASILAFSDILGAALKLLVLWAILRRPVLRPTSCMLAGLFGGLAYLVRYDAIFLMIVVAGALLLINPDRESLRHRLAKAGLFACGAILTASPWLVTNWRTHGNPLAGSGYLLVATHFYMPGLQDQFDAALKEPEPAAAVAQLEVATKFQSIQDVVSHDPVRFLRKYLYNLYSHGVGLGAKVLRFPAYLIAPVGLVLLLRDLTRRRLLYLVVCLFGYLSLGLVGFFQRFYLFLLPLGFLLVAYALFEALPTTHRLRTVNAPVSWLLLLLIAAPVGVSAYRETSRLIVSEPRYLFGIAEFVKRHSSPGERIIARKPHLAYLAGLVNTFPFVHSADAYLEEARRRGARFIVYSDYEARVWPGLKSLRDPRAVPAGLTLIYYHPPSRTVIYEAGRSER